ncbi:AI-2E family transporter [Flavobacterium sp. ZB4P23]|nr:AI-2E family transporter [Flavobacterium sp. ZB4P23]
MSALIFYFRKTLFIPLCFALLISFILYPVCKWIEKKGIQKGLAIFICILEPHFWQVPLFIYYQIDNGPHS